MVVFKLFWLISTLHKKTSIFRFFWSNFEQNHQLTPKNRSNSSLNSISNWSRKVRLEICLKIRREAWLVIRLNLSSTSILNSFRHLFYHSLRHLQNICSKVHLALLINISLSTSTSNSRQTSILLIFCIKCKYSSTTKWQRSRQNSQCYAQIYIYSKHTFFRWISVE